MGFLEDLGTAATGAGTPLDVLDIFGGNAANDALRAAGEQEQFGRDAIDEIRAAEGRGQDFLNPFAAVGQQGLSQSGFLGDSQAQFDFLQNNPLFQLALDNANRTTQASAASRGRLSAGDTLQQLSNNVLLSASPLIDRQRQDINNQLNFGGNLATQQATLAGNTGTNVANLLTDIGATRAGGIVGGANAQSQGSSNALGILGTIGSFFSDSRLKGNAEKINSKNGYDIWSWTWNETAREKFNLSGNAIGVMFSDVLEKNPDAVSYQDGYGKVNYSMIGV